MLVAGAAKFGGQDAVATFWVDKLPNGAQLWAALKTELKQPTVPYVFVNSEFLGGCDDTKKLQGAGTLATKLYAAAATHSLGAKPAPKKKAAPAAASDSHAEGGRGQAANYMPDESFVDVHAKPATGDATPPAPPCLFFFPEVVDANVIRLTAIQVVAVCVIGIVWRERLWAHYMILGLALDNLGRLLFGPGPSPLAQVARLAAALLRRWMEPKLRPGVPKQFAAGCGLFMATVSTVFLFLAGFDSKVGGTTGRAALGCGQAPAASLCPSSSHPRRPARCASTLPHALLPAPAQKIIPACFLGVYAGLAFLEASIDFCMGCVMFGFLVKAGLLPPEVYAVGIAAKPEAEYTYAEATKWLELPAPEPVRVGYPGKPPSAIDVRYKTKTNDHDRQNFSILKARPGRNAASAAARTARCPARHLQPAVPAASSPLQPLFFAAVCQDRAVPDRAGAVRPGHAVARCRDAQHRRRRRPVHPRHHRRRGRHHLGRRLPGRLHGVSPLEGPAWLLGANRSFGPRSTARQLWLKCSVNNPVAPPTQNGHADTRPRPGSTSTRSARSGSARCGPMPLSSRPPRSC
jgi:hypothetical protein